MYVNYVQQSIWKFAYVAYNFVTKERPAMVIIIVEFVATISTSFHRWSKIFADANLKMIARREQRWQEGW